jgi:hypothetical protein
MSNHDESYPSEDDALGEPLDEIGPEERQRYVLIRSLKKANGADEFVRAISQDLLLNSQANWGDLLGAAPAALCCLGQTFVATTSSPAISSLELPMNGPVQYAHLNISPAELRR